MGTALTTVGQQVLDQLHETLGEWLTDLINRHGLRHARDGLTRLDQTVERLQQRCQRAIEQTEREFSASQPDLAGRLAKLKYVSLTPSSGLPGAAPSSAWTSNHRRPST